MANVNEDENGNETTSCPRQAHSPQQVRVIVRRGDGDGDGDVKVVRAAVPVDSLISDVLLKIGGVMILPADGVCVETEADGSQTIRQVPSLSATTLTLRSCGARPGSVVQLSIGALTPGEGTGAMGLLGGVKSFEVAGWTPEQVGAHVANGHHLCIFRHSRA